MNRSDLYYDVVGDMSRYEGQDAYVAPQLSQAPQKTADTTVTDTAGQGMMMSGNPYLMAAGLGLSAYGQAKQRELARKQQNVNREVARRNQVMQMMANLGSGIGQIG